MQALMRAAIGFKRLRAQKKAAVQLQKWTRKRRQQGDQWRAMLAKARETAAHAKEQKASIEVKHKNDTVDQSIFVVCGNLSTGLSV
jgi:hypothetical protein